jgi:succinyl-diaminopimelate desuccinylase
MTAVSAWQRIKKRIAGYGRDVVGLQRALTALPALGPHNGGKGEWAKARYLEARLKTLKPERILRVSCPDRAVPEKNRPNLIALF